VHSSQLSSYKIIDRVLGVAVKNDRRPNWLMGSYKIRHHGIDTDYGIIYKGNIENPQKPILLRINSACYTSDIFGCQRCDCNWQLLAAMDEIDKQGNGMIIYDFNHEGRGAGLTNKLKSYALMDKYNYTTFEAFLSLGIEPDSRNYNYAISILQDLKIKSVDLISNNLKKESILIEHGIQVNQRISVVANKKEWQNYLISKKQQFGHDIDEKYFIYSNLAELEQGE
jgi:3,4-dihydroxy 2-butanone 4-phosphate synthase/GTP cyclohydrolase II